MSTSIQTESDFTSIPKMLPVLPLRNTLAYPTMVLPLAVGISRSIQLVEDAVRGDRLIGLVGMEDPTIDEPTSDQVWSIGTVARIHRVVRAQGEAMQVIVQGLERFKVTRWLEPNPYLRAEIETLPDKEEPGVEMDALLRSLKELAKEVVSLSPHLPDEVNRFLTQVEDPRHLIYLITVNARISKRDGQRILESGNLKEKIRILIRHLSREKEILTLEHKIQTEAHEEMDKAQREFFLRQQLKAIRKELGDEEETGELVEDYRAKVDASGMPEEARKETLRELKRLESMPPQAAEYSLIKTYIDWMVDLPWTKSSRDQLDIERARRVLDEDHYDLADVKSRILEYLAVRKLITERAEKQLPKASRMAARRVRMVPAVPVTSKDSDSGKKGKKGKRKPGQAALGDGKRMPTEDVLGVFAELPGDEISDHELQAEMSELLEAEEEEFAEDGDVEEARPKASAKAPDSNPEPSEEDPGNDPALRAGTILCFVGPPGVGKTSLGKSIARALGRNFTRMSLGGMRDEAEIRGHRRTYVGALPGRIIQGIKRAGTRNPVFMLDEVDKLGSDWRGDPASALLEVLDPAQNHSYRDHYLDVDYDLSDVIFVATANSLYAIPEPLRDRMEIIQIEGYTDHDKVTIAKQYLVPRQIRAHGLRPNEVTFSDEALRKIIHDYTRESGVRELERQIGSVCRKVAVAIAEKKKRRFQVTPKVVREYLKAERFVSERRDEYRVPGVATGLAVTPGGGDILYIEATRMRGKGSLTLTGQLGDVMKESAQIAYNYVRSKASQWDIDSEVFDRTDIHVHIPAGAIPKDGPSAGVAMTGAMVSLLTGRVVRPNVGMTGEVTLRGRVLPIGGLKAKVLAAHRAGLDTVVLPKRNEHELDDVPSEVREKMRFVPIEMIEEALDVMLAPPKGASKKKGGSEKPEPVKKAKPRAVRRAKVAAQSRPESKSRPDRVAKRPRRTAKPDSSASRVAR
jgi:ATP-dependent Lon protease